MNNQVTKARRDFIESYKIYFQDIKWLRKKFGIVPEPKDFALKKAFSAAMKFTQKNDLQSLTENVSAFKEFHRAIIYDVAWDLLERTKESLKLIRAANPRLFEEKRKLWIQASWAFSTAIYMKNFNKYYDSINISAQI